MTTTKRTQEQETIHRATIEGGLMADALFRSRMPKGGPRKGMKNVEVHLQEGEVAVLLAEAFERGARYARSVKAKEG